MRQLLKVNVFFTIEPETEHTPLKGNVLASGDDETDEAAEKEVQKQLETGNEWAWCCVKVTAVWHSTSGTEYSGTACLGCCSYESEKDFRGDYYTELQKEALADLNTKLATIRADLDELTDRETQ
ncbi:hypothetical protein LCGC14_0479340 [marine sediment metagenome]|uniref:Uncharacterized protein n=1 Tax=marine sediment metagenome TaxID=412755 RepID=A0A0F9VIE3_9ZZZZ